MEQHGSESSSKQEDTEKRLDQLREVRHTKTKEPFFLSSKADFLLYRQ